MISFRAWCLIMNPLQAFWANLPDLRMMALNLVLTLAILVVGWLVSNVAGRWVRGVAGRSSRIDPTVIPIVRDGVVWTIRIVVLLAVLARLGVQTASLVAMLGASALAIGLALQGTLQNFAAGIMLLVLRPVRSGEFVSIEGKGMGTVDEIGLFMTRFEQIDGTILLLPNTLVWGNPIVNYSRNKTRRLDMLLAVRYGDDLETAIKALQDFIVHYDGVLKDPAPEVMVMEYRDSTIMLNIRAWIDAATYWDVYFDLHRKAPQVLIEAGLGTPIPLREVRAVNIAPDPQAARAGASAK